MSENKDNLSNSNAEMKTYGLEGEWDKKDIDNPENWKDSKIKPGMLLSTKNKIDTAYKVSNGQLEEIEAEKSLLVLHALKNISSNEEAVLFLHEQAKYFIILSEENMEKDFILNQA